MPNPVVSLVTLSSAKPKAGQALTITVTGTDFNPTSVQLLVIDGAGNATTATLTSATATSVVGTVTAPPEGTYSIVLQNGIDGPKTAGTPLVTTGASFHEKFKAFMAKFKAQLGTHVPGGSSTLSPDDQKNILALHSEGDGLLTEFAPFPKLLGFNVVEDGVPPVLVNNAAEETKARADGFTTVLPLPDYPTQVTNTAGKVVTVNNYAEQMAAQPPIPNYPQTLADSTVAKRPDVVVNTFAEDKAARADGFTIVVATPAGKKSAPAKPVPAAS